MVRGTASATRERILGAATDLFRERGLSGVSVRDIAAASQADPALVIRHFGSKESLFLEAMRVTPNQPLFAGPVEHLGRECVRFLLEFSDGTRATFLALLRGSNEPAIERQLLQAHADLFVDPLRARLSGPDADLRARLALWVGVATMAVSTIALLVLGPRRGTIEFDDSDTTGTAADTAR